jgi:hypothetical protein
VTPLEVLEQWYDAHRRGDMEAARSVLAPGALIELPDRELHGFDEFLAWSAARAVERPDLSMAVDEVLPGQDHVAALLAMGEGERHWRQLAVYTVRDDRIVGIWASESPHPIGT